MGPRFRGDDSRASEALPHGVEAPGQNALLRMQAVFRFVENDGMRSIHHLVRDFFAPMRLTLALLPRMLARGSQTPLPR